jgi:Domain of unknown function (DUF6431)
LPGHDPEQNPITTILFISCSGEQDNLESDWTQLLPRQCPVCDRPSIIGHGRRRKQAHDAYRDWIQTRRGICHGCGITFTFLPSFSLPYTHYSLLARSAALYRYFIDFRSWEAAAPTVKDPDRIADPSTLRRWFCSLDSSQPPFGFLRRLLTQVKAQLSCGQVVRHGALRLSWPTLFAFLQQLWPLRL